MIWQRKVGIFPFASNAKGWVELLPKKGERRQAHKTICKSTISILFFFQKKPTSH